MCMTLFEKIRLSWRYGSALYIVSLVVTAVAVVSALVDPMMISVCLALKIISIPVILYLFVSLQRSLSIYFYLNLGISKSEYYAIPIVVEFVVFVLLMTISGLVSYAVG